MMDEKEKEDLAFVLSNPKGVRFIARLLDYCGVFKTSFSNDPLKMAFMEGKRNVGLEILAKALDIDSNLLYNFNKEFYGNKQNGNESKSE